MKRISWVTHVKLCVRPGPVCLQGGCGHCDSGTFKTIKWLRDYSWRNGFGSDFVYGFESGWPNREIRAKESRS